MTRTNLQIILQEKPSGIPELSHFSEQETPVPEIADGQILCKNLYLSLDPYMRGQMSGRHITAPVAVGDVLQGQTVAEIVATKNDKFKQGQRVLCFGGWQEYAVSDGRDAVPIDERITPPSLALGILGMPGLTAYGGMYRQAKPQKGDVILVAAAAGPVGSMVGMIGKIHNCRVIGMAGSDEKCQWVMEQAGFDACINYKTQNVEDALDELCPDGINIYFDNVGGDVLKAATKRLAMHGRIILCGLMSDYNAGKMSSSLDPGLLIKARAIVHGLVVFDFAEDTPKFIDDALGWLAEGKIAYKEDVTEGLARAPEAFRRLMKGENFGKTIVKIA